MNYHGTTKTWTPPASRRSVEGYDIHDANGKVLYDGDTVRYSWGGGTDNTGRYRLYRYHRLRISKRGTLSISGCCNIVKAKELVKVFDLVEINVDVKEYIR